MSSTTPTIVTIPQSSRPTNTWSMFFVERMWPTKHGRAVKTPASCSSNVFRFQFESKYKPNWFASSYGCVFHLIPPANKSDRCKWQRNRCSESETERESTDSYARVYVPRSLYWWWQQRRRLFWTVRRVWVCVWMRRACLSVFVCRVAQSGF